MISYLDLHKNNNRANPEQFLKYKHSMLLYKLYNHEDYDMDWVSLNFQHQFAARNNVFMASKPNKLRVRLNIVTNRLSILNGSIPLSWLNLSLASYKIKCKKTFLTNEGLQ